MGCCAGLARKPLTGSEVKRFCVKHTLSQAFHIGSAILSARSHHKDPVAAAVAVGGGKILFSGKVVDVRRVTTEGFARGETIVSGQHRECLKIDFQNENLVATLNGKVVATTPERICILETGFGRPLQTEEMRYGLQVTGILLPASPLLCTPEALAIVGPRGFGYDMDFVQHVTYQEPQSMALPS